MKATLLALGSLGFAVALQASECFVVASPDGRIDLQISGAAWSPQDRRPDFQIRFQGRLLVRGELGLSASGSNLFETTDQRTSSQRRSDSTYTLPFGKDNQGRDRFTELTLDLEHHTSLI